MKIIILISFFLLACTVKVSKDPTAVDPENLLTLSEVDEDGDGYCKSGYETNTLCQYRGIIDCNDTDANVHSEMQFYPDSDSDGYGSSQAESFCATTPPNGYTANNQDCNDSNNSAYPGGVEICGDSIDQDCNGSDLSCSTIDGDSDGYSPQQGDCNDNNANINPGETETPYNGVDDDCNASTPDDDIDGDNFLQANDCNDNDASVHSNITYYLDSDGDGYGSTTSAQFCVNTAPSGYASNNTDCDDTNASLHDNCCTPSGLGTTLAWDQHPNPNADLTGFIIYRGINNTNFQAVATVQGATATSVAIGLLSPTLDPCVSNYLYATATTNTQESTPSNHVCYGMTCQ